MLLSRASAQVSKHLHPKHRFLFSNLHFDFAVVLVQFLWPTDRVKLAYVILFYEWNWSVKESNYSVVYVWSLLELNDFSK